MHEGNEFRDTIAVEVNRIISPRFLYILVSLSFALLMAVAYLWNVAETNRSWVVSLNGSIKRLEAQIDVAAELRRQNEILLAIAERLEVDMNNDKGE